MLPILVEVAESMALKLACSGPVSFSIAGMLAMESTEKNDISGEERCKNASRHVLPMCAFLIHNPHCGQQF